MTEFSGGYQQAFEQRQPKQDNGLSDCIGAVSQLTGTEMESKPLRQGSVRKQEKASALPHAGPAGAMPGCVDAGGGSVVVRDGEKPLQGEGTQELSRNRKLGDDTLTEGRQIWVPQLQKRLAQKAVQVPSHRFGDLYEILTWESVLEEAADRLLGNKGSRTPGLDGIQRDILRRNRTHHLKILQEQLITGTFQPMPVKRIYIPKRNGKMRPLGIPTLYDRWVQMAIKMILEPIFEGDFAEYSHGFRPNRSCHTAIAHIYRLTVQPRRKVYWVIEGDIKGFFDHVHHKKLMSLLKVRIRDKHLLDLIWKFLKAGVMEGEGFKKTDEGTPQGGVLSPLLANIYLNHFDQWFAQEAMLGDSHARDRNRKAGHANFIMVRYADDFVVFSNGSKAETVAFKAKMKAWLAQELKLELSEEKTAITHYTDGFNFLGFTIKKTRAIEKAAGSVKREVVVHYPSTESVQRAIRKISEMTDRNTLIHSHGDQIEALNGFLRGWGEYFRHASSKRALRYVGSHAYMRMWKWLVGKDKYRHGWRKVRKKYGKDNTWVAGDRRLLILQNMKVEYPFYRKPKHPCLDFDQDDELRELEPFKDGWSGIREYGPGWSEAKEKALRTTQGVCAVCESSVNVEVHHIKARRKGGGEGTTNLVPLCRTCHRQSEIRNGQVSHQVREIVTKLSSGEPDEAKVSRPVRGETLRKPT